MKYLFENTWRWFCKENITYSFGNRNIGICRNVYYNNLKRFSSASSKSNNFSKDSSAIYRKKIAHNGRAKNLKNLKFSKVKHDKYKNINHINKNSKNKNSKNNNSKNKNSIDGNLKKSHIGHGSNLGKSNKLNNKSYELKNKPASITTKENLYDKMKIKSKYLHQERNNTLKQNKELAEKITSFDALRIDEKLREAVLYGPLIDLDYKTPTTIQKIAIFGMQKNWSRHPNDRKISLIAGETGSGKTLAYLIPIMHQLRVEELDEESLNKLKISNPHVRALILVPNSNLSIQVKNIIKSIAHAFKMSSTNIDKTISQARLKNLSQSNVDLLVATPGRLKYVLEKIPNFLDGVQHLVIDEADTLLDKTFQEETEKIFIGCKFFNNLKNLVFCSATIPKRLNGYLSTKFPDMNYYVAPNVHRLPSHVDVNIIDVRKDPYFDDKMKALLHIIYKIKESNEEPGKVKRILVFVNHNHAVMPIVSKLREHNIDAIGISKTTGSSEIREKSIEEFSKPALDVPTNSEEKSIKVAICTDLMSRGVDVDSIKNVILYDAPFTATDFVHRIGRTGRMGSRGHAYVLFDNHDYKKEYVNVIRQDLKRGFLI